ncbi:MAG: hypothetical protein J0I66_09000 [Microbacterium sp.]|nr:hypothetical protein [Microbacterium sp.]
MPPADWTPHRRDDGELVGWIRPADDIGETWIAVDVLGRDASAAVDWLDAEAALEARGLAWLGEVWIFERPDAAALRVRLVEVTPERVCRSAGCPRACELLVQLTIRGGGAHGRGDRPPPRSSCRESGPGCICRRSDRSSLSKASTGSRQGRDHERLRRRRVEAVHRPWAALAAPLATPGPPSDLPAGPRRQPARRALGSARLTRALR